MTTSEKQVGQGYQYTVLASVLGQATQPGLLETELLLDHSKRLLNLGADVRFGSLDQILHFPSGVSGRARRFRGPIPLSAYCRERGLYPEQVERWRQAAQDANEKPVLTLKEKKELEKLRAQDQREIKALKKELQRKEKAMAEMAALLVLRKKWEAFCSEDAEG